MNSPLLSKNFTFAIPADDLAAVQAALQVLQDKLLPLLVDLNAAERRNLVKMGSKSVDFVGKTLGYARANPQVKPGYVDLDVLASDWTALDTLRAMQQALHRLNDMADDTLLLVGSKAYAAALACYRAFQTAEKMGHPGAALIVDDLSARFQGQGRIAKPPTAPQDEPPALPQ